MSYLEALVPSVGTLVESGVASLFSGLFQPVGVVRVLVQSGFEPIAPFPTTDFFGRPALKFPGILTYAKWIKANHGWSGLYKSLVPRTLELFLHTVIRTQVKSALSIALPPPKHFKSAVAPHQLAEYSDEELEELFMPLPSTLLGHVRVWGAKWLVNVVSLSTASLITHPFIVVAFRMIAQMASNETLYSSMLGSFAHIYRTEGVAGFYRGLAPSILSEILSTTIMLTVQYGIEVIVEVATQRQKQQKAADAAKTKHARREQRAQQEELIEDDDNDDDDDDQEELDPVASLQQFTVRQQTIQLTTEFLRYLSHPLSYSLSLVRTHMILSGSDLAVGNPPNMPLYKSWVDCFNHLKSQGGWSQGLMRGNSLLRRVVRPN